MSLGKTLSFHNHSQEKRVEDHSEDDVFFSGFLNMLCYVGKVYFIDISPL